MREPPITPFVECPNCKKLLDLGCSTCPECREPISDEYAGLSAITNVINTDACRLAKDIRDRDRIMPLIVVAESIAVYFMDTRLFGFLFFFWLAVIPSVAQLFVVGIWFLRFRRFAPLGDSDYLRAREHVRWSAALWVTIFALQLFVVVWSRI